MKILIATHNREKFLRYQQMLKQFDDLDVTSLVERNISDKADEPHLTSRKNAQAKAKHYGDLSGLVTIAIDEAVTTNFLPDNEQPGVFVRRFSTDKKELTDEDVVAIWQKIFIKYPQSDKKFIWDFAIAFYDPKSGLTDDCQVQQISFISLEISDKPSHGYPMSRFLSPWKNGKAYSEMTEEEKMQEDKRNFAGFLSKFGQWKQKVFNQ